jgi:magnesium-transporting ATPase (P-type)
MDRHGRKLRIGFAGSRVLKSQTGAPFCGCESDKPMLEVSVIRDGLFTEMKNTELLVGDAVLVEHGNKIPVDGLCIEWDNRC